MLAATRAAHCTLVVSSIEQEMLERDCPGANIQLLSNIHSVRDCPIPFAARSGILFMGSFPHHPNQDAMAYYLDEIAPRLHESLPDLELWIAGRNPPDWLKSRATGKNHVLGYVPDIDSLLCRARVAIAPLRYGAGVKGKVLESMSVGLPVVGTSIAAEGLGAVNEREMLIADSPEEFANAVIRLHQDPYLWEQLSENGQRLVSESFSFAAARRNLDRILASLRLETA
jgi:glycosyltransferase involved in cell wall biosynthesis